MDFVTKDMARACTQNKAANVKTQERQVRSHQMQSHATAQSSSQVSSRVQRGKLMCIARVCKHSVHVGYIMVVAWERHDSLHKAAHAACETGGVLFEYTHGKRSTQCVCALAPWARVCGVQESSGGVTIHSMHKIGDRGKECFPY